MPRIADVDLRRFTMEELGVICLQLEAEGATLKSVGERWGYTTASGWVDTKRFTRDLERSGFRPGWTLLQIKKGTTSGSRKG